MITIQQLRDSLEYAIAESANATPSCSKSVFLDALSDRLMGCLPSGPANDRILTLLKESNKLPVCHSRLNYSDLRRRAQCMSWSTLHSSMQAISELVWETTTVSAGDCDECMGEEMIYLWDEDRDGLIRKCDLCSNTLDLQGGKVVSTGRLVAPTTTQLEEAGVINPQ